MLMRQILLYLEQCWSVLTQGSFTVSLCTTQGCPVVMSTHLYLCVFLLFSYLLPNFIWLDPKPLSVTNSFCRLAEHFCLVWGRGFFFGRNILIICMKSLVSSSALGISGTDSSREVNECHCISEKELFHAITLKVHERTDWKEWGKEREHERG